MAAIFERKSVDHLVRKLVTMFITNNYIYWSRRNKLNSKLVAINVTHAIIYACVSNNNETIEEHIRTQTVRIGLLPSNEHRSESSRARRDEKSCGLQTDMSIVWGSTRGVTFKESRMCNAILRTTSDDVQALRNTATNASASTALITWRVRT